MLNWKDLNFTTSEISYGATLFRKCDPNPQAQQLSGAQIKDLFVQSGLSQQILFQVWNLADQGNKRFLNKQDFMVALRLIALAQQGKPLSHQSLMDNKVLPLPVFQEIAPPKTENPGNPGGSESLSSSGKGANVGGKAGAPIGGVALPGMGRAAPFGGVSLPGLTMDNKTQSSSLSSSASKAPTESIWEMGVTERNKYKSLFPTVDTDRDGFISGKEAATYFRQSGLDNSILRQLWILADHDKDNKLSEEEFFIAMHLVMVVKKKGANLPSTLPPELDPSRPQKPSMLLSFGDPKPEPSLGHPKPEPGLGGLPSLVPTSSSSSSRSDDPLAGVGEDDPPVSLLPPLSAGVSGGTDVGLGGSLVLGMNTTNLGFEKKIQSQQMAMGFVKNADEFSQDRLNNSGPETRGYAAKLQEEAEKLHKEQELLRKLQNQLAEANREMVAKREELEAKREQFNTLHRQRTTFESQLSSHMGQFTSLQLETQQMDSYLSKLRSEVAELEKKKQEQKALYQAAKEKQDALRRERGEINEMLSRARLELEQLRKSSAMLKSGMEMQIEANQELREQLKETIAIIQEEKQYPSQLPAAAASIETSATVAVDSAKDLMKELDEDFGSVSLEQNTDVANEPDPFAIDGSSGAGDIEDDWNKVEQQVAAKVSSIPTKSADDPFGETPSLASEKDGLNLSMGKAKDDPFGDAADPFSGSSGNVDDPFGAGTKAETTDDPFGGATETKTGAMDDDPFNDPFQAPQPSNPVARAEEADPFDTGDPGLDASKDNDPFAGSAAADDFGAWDGASNAPIEKKLSGKKDDTSGREGFGNLRQTTQAGKVEDDPFAAEAGPTGTVTSSVDGGDWDAWD